MGIGASNLGDAILFPAPPCSYELKLPGLVWIEEHFLPLKPLHELSPAAAAQQQHQHSARRRTQRLFPACLIEAPTGEESKCVLLYWHGNSCDLGHIYEELEILGKYLNCHILAIEYPGYGIAPALNGPLPKDISRAATAAAAEAFKTREAAAEATAEAQNRAAAAAATEVATMNRVTARARQERQMKTMGETINEWSRSAFNFLLWLGMKPEAIICTGRSIGTGPASYLAASLVDENISVGGVILHAPYLSVHEIVQEYSSLGTWFIANHWSNAENLQKMAAADCPLLIIHGEDDEVIPTEHGRKLFEGYIGEQKEGFFPADSSHNSYYIIDDLGKPMEKFIAEKSRTGECPLMRLEIPSYMREAPLWQLPLPLVESVPAPPAAVDGSALAAEHAIAATRTGKKQDAQAAAVAGAVGWHAALARESSQQSKIHSQSAHHKTDGSRADADSKKASTSAAAAGETAAKALGVAGLGAVAAAAFNRSSNALGQLLAHATGSTGGEWDVGITQQQQHQQQLRDSKTKKSEVITAALVGAPLATVDMLPHAEASTNKVSATGAAGEATGRDSSPRIPADAHLSEMLESGMLSVSTLHEIMGEALKEVNQGESDAPSKD